MLPLKFDLLLKLADLVEARGDDRFDFQSWATGEDLNTCGTTACALGTATLLPETGLDVVHVDGTGIYHIEHSDGAIDLAAAIRAFVSEPVETLAYQASQDIDRALFLLFYPNYPDERPYSAWCGDDSIGETRRGPDENATAAEWAAWCRWLVGHWQEGNIIQ